MPNASLADFAFLQSEIYNLKSTLHLLTRKFFGKVTACGKEKEIMLVDYRTPESDLSISFAR
jgi:hypothetical protein